MFTLILQKSIKLLPIVLLTTLSLAPIKAEDLKAEDIIAKHRESIGSQEKLTQIKNRLAVGTSEFIIKLPYRKLVGKALVASEINNLLFVSSFNSKDYPFERIGWFSNKISIPFVVPGAHSPLGGFLNENNKVLSEKLLTGSISSSWALLDSDLNKSRLKIGGKKKIDGRETYILNYFPKQSGSDFTIKLFFDAQTFHHLRTEYQYKYPSKEAQMGELGTGSPGGRDVLIEDFRDFRDENGLVLPHSYKINLLIDRASKAGEFEWNITISQYLFNQTLKEDFFNFDNFDASRQ